MSHLTQWVHANEKILATAGPYFSATVLFFTFLVTITLTRSIKKTDTILNFGELFIDIIEKRQKLQRKKPRPEGNGLPEITATELQQEAMDFYAQFFSLMFSEHYAYRVGNLDRNTFKLWITSRKREHDNNDSIHGVTYQEGWKHWYRAYHAHDDEFTRLMRNLHAGTASPFMLVMRYGPRTKRVLLWQCIFRPYLWFRANLLRGLLTVAVVFILFVLLILLRG